MKRNFKNLVLLLALLPMSKVQGQISFDYLGEKWNDYQMCSSCDLTSLHRNHFKDSVSVNEMKDAFLKNKDIRFDKSPYEGFDSVVYIVDMGRT